MMFASWGAKHAIPSGTGITPYRSGTARRSRRNLCRSGRHRADIASVDVLTGQVLVGRWAARAHLLWLAASADGRHYGWTVVCRIKMG